MTQMPFRYAKYQMTPLESAHWALVQQERGADLLPSAISVLKIRNS